MIIAQVLVSFSCLELFHWGLITKYVSSNADGKDPKECPGLHICMLGVCAIFCSGVLALTVLFYGSSLPQEDGEEVFGPNYKSSFAGIVIGVRFLLLEWFLPAEHAGYARVLNLPDSNSICEIVEKIVALLYIFVIVILSVNDLLHSLFNVPRRKADEAPNTNEANKQIVSEKDRLSE